MSGLREAFDQIVTDIPVYGDLDRAIEQAELERRRRYGAAVGLAAAAVVLVVVAGVVAVSGGTDAAPPVSPSPMPEKSQSPQTWSDTPVAAADGYGWDVSNPLTAVRDAWFPVVAEHLDPEGRHLQRQDFGGFGWPGEGSTYSSDGRVELLTDRGPFEDGCRYLTTPTPTNGTVSCSTERVAGSGGERARISRYGRRCGAFDGPADAYETCGDFSVAVAVERRDGLIGYLVVNGRGTPDYNPVPVEAMVDAAADERLTLPDAAFTVPSNQAAASVVSDHLPRFQEDETFRAPASPGSTGVWGKLGRRGVSVQVWPAGETPTCGRRWLIECVERRVYGADDPTTVFVGAWDEEDWADCCPRNSRMTSREFVYVGPRHTVVVRESLAVKADAEPVGADLDQRVIDVLLDPRLQ